MDMYNEGQPKQLVRDSKQDLSKYKLLTKTLQSGVDYNSAVVFVTRLKTYEDLFDNVIKCRSVVDNCPGDTLTIYVGLVDARISMIIAFKEFLGAVGASVTTIFRGQMDMYNALLFTAGQTRAISSESTVTLAPDMPGVSELLESINYNPKTAEEALQANLATDII
jgi:hypothetical protein